MGAPLVRSPAMADVQPFRAVRYSGAAGPLADLVAPPYDAVAEDERAELFTRSPYNVVHLTLPESARRGRAALPGVARGGDPRAASASPRHGSRMESTSGRTASRASGTASSSPSPPSRTRRGAFSPTSGRTRVSAKSASACCARRVCTSSRSSCSSTDGRDAQRDPPVSKSTARGSGEFPTSTGTPTPGSAAHRGRPPPLRERPRARAEAGARGARIMALRRLDGRPRPARLPDAPGLQPAGRTSRSARGRAVPRPRGGVRPARRRAATNGRGDRVSTRDVELVRGERGRARRRARRPARARRASPTRRASTTPSAPSTAARPTSRSSSASRASTTSSTVARRGERMPPKSTYFYPKPLSGLLFHPVDR